MQKHLYFYHTFCVYTRKAVILHRQFEQSEATKPCLKIIIN